MQVRNSTYKKQADITRHVAKVDLKKLSDLGLLAPKGERRGRVYIASAYLTNLVKESRLPKERFDPFEDIENMQKPIQQGLPGLAIANMTGKSVS